MCGGVVLVVKPPRSSIKTENYKVPFGNSARTTREPEPFFASTRARQRSVPGAALSLPFRTVHLNGFQASAVSAIQGPRQWLAARRAIATTKPRNCPSRVPFLPRRNVDADADAQILSRDEVIAS